MMATCRHAGSIYQSTFPASGKSPTEGSRVPISDEAERLRVARLGERWFHSLPPQLLQSEIGEAMKAIVIQRFGGPEVLKLQEVADPRPQAGEVLVRVHAVGVNFADVMMAQGGYPGTPAPPVIAGREFAGVVKGGGERVMGYTQMGALRKRLPLPATCCGRSPWGGARRKRRPFR